MKNEIKSLQSKNNSLERENKSLSFRLNYIFEVLKKFLRKLLRFGNENTKDETVEIVKDCYDSNEFEMMDVAGISRGTTKQDELFDYVDAPDYLKEKVRDYDCYKNEHDKDDDMGMSL